MVNSIKGFLRYLKAVHIKQAPVPSNLSVVCGNEAADFDSVVSALAYAYYSYQNDPKHPLIPIINIPKADLSLRKDIVRALRKVDITEDLLFFNEDLKTLKEDFGFVKAVLVDHNQVESANRLFIDKVIGIIDHHKDQGLYSDANPRLIVTTGSCSSLVVNYWEKILPDFVSKRDALLLCLGAVLLDTSNYHSKVEKPDLEALKLYEQLFDDLDRIGYYKQLRQDKDDLSSLSIRDILRKDYKEFDLRNRSTGDTLKVGIASVVKPLAWFYEEYGGESAFREECLRSQSQRNVDMFLIMTSWLDESDFKRELVILSQSQNISQKVVDDISEKLQLRQKEFTTLSPAPYFFKTFEQLNVSASRKQVAPFVTEALEHISE